MERLSTMIEGERKKAMEEPENTHVEVETHKSNRLMWFRSFGKKSLRS